MLLVLFNSQIRSLSGATTPGQSGPGNNGNKGMLRIPQSASINGTSPSDCFVSYPGHSLEQSYASAEKQSVYSTAPADSATYHWETILPSAGLFNFSMAISLTFCCILGSVIYVCIQIDI